MNLVRILCAALALTSTSLTAASGRYEAAILAEEVRQKIEAKVDEYVAKKSLEYSGPDAVYAFTFTCSESDFFKIPCTFSYSDELGLLGLGYVVYDNKNQTARFANVVQSKSKKAAAGDDAGAESPTSP